MAAIVKRDPDPLVLTFVDRRTVVDCSPKQKDLRLLCYHVPKGVPGYEAIIGAIRKNKMAAQSENKMATSDKDDHFDRE